MLHQTGLVTPDGWRGTQVCTVVSFPTCWSVLTCLLRLSDFYKNEMNAGHVSIDSDRKTAERIWITGVFLTAVRLLNTVWLCENSIDWLDLYWLPQKGISLLLRIYVVFFLLFKCHSEHVKDTALLSGLCAAVWPAKVNGRLIVLTSYSTQ